MKKLIATLLVFILLLISIFTNNKIVDETMVTGGNTIDNAEILRKTIDAVKKYGIPEYVEKWNPPTIDSADSKFYEKLSQLVGSYHKHSFILVNGVYVPNVPNVKIKSRSQRVKTNESSGRLVDFATKKNIGIITFYTYNCSGDECWNPETSIMGTYIESIKEHLRDWEHSVDGVILDFRQHSGGTVFPMYYAFSDIFNNSTYYAWSNKKTDSNDDVWVSIVDGKLKHNTKLLNKDIHYKKPIAVVVGPATSSSGEFGAAMFYGRKHVRFFGKKTDGRLSGNENISISDKVELVLTGSLINTVDGVLRSDEKIVPDVLTEKPIADATEWIKSYK